MYIRLPRLVLCAYAHAGAYMHVPAGTCIYARGYMHVHIRVFAPKHTLYSPTYAYLRPIYAQYIPYIHGSKTSAGSVCVCVCVYVWCVCVCVCV